MNVEQLAEQLRILSSNTPKSEGLSCLDIAGALGCTVQKARPLIYDALRRGILEHADYYKESSVGIVRRFKGLRLAKTRIGKRKTKSS